jgi:magnesium transporter
MMRKIKYKNGIKVQLSLLDYTGNYKNIETEMQLFVYDDSDFIECNNLKINDIHKNIDLSKVNWLNVHGLNDIEIIKSIGNYLQIDNFMLGDILNTIKRTKIEEYHDILFFNIKSLLPSNNHESIDVEQISFILKNGILVSFQEKRSDFFSHLRERIRTHSGIVRTKKADYLLYLLLDAIMENFYITIENEEDKVENLINLSKSSANPNVLMQIEKHRDNFNFLKRAIIPLRDSLYSIKSMKEDNVFNAIEHENYSFFDRLHQKCLELLEQIEYDMTTLESASNFFFSAQSQKMNEVMKTLTVVSVIFMPLTFIVGVYGMNFKYLPELEYHNGYLWVWIAMILITIVMAIYFKWKKYF